MDNSKSDKRELITFHRLGNYDLNRLQQEQPSCFNGIVRAKKYKITIEEVPESRNIVAARLQALWDKEDNHHNYKALIKAAEEIGYEYQGSFGRG